MKKQNKVKYFHIGIIILGIIFISIAAFHPDIWFDESYSVAIAKHKITDIWTITGNDVHPPVYYWMLHMVFLIFGNNVTIFRLFSVLAVAILGILGYTHVRKDFGEKTGLLFSFLAYFLPVMCTYSQEIRMYSWACLFTFVMAIYAYRFYQNIKNEKEENKLKNLSLFGLFSMLCCYTHYYALVTACVVNLMLLIYCIKKRKTNSKDLRNFLILAAIQVILYVPWLYYLWKQIRHVGGGFWIGLGISTLVEVPSFQFKRQLDTNFAFNWHTIVSLVVSLLVYIYVGYQIYKAKKAKESIWPGILAIIVYIAVIGIYLLPSFIQPVLFSRYLFVMTGIYIFALSFFMAKEKRRWVTLALCIVILALGTWSNITNVFINYDESNMKQIEYMKEKIQPDDIIIYSNIGNGGVIAAFFPENKQYFINGAHWDIEEAYKSYGPGMETIYNVEETIKDYHGRIWLVDSENMGLYNDFPKEGINILEGPQRFDTKYQDYIYNIMLLEKK
ncbi:MAG: hypothetical protein HFJ28_04180 [Clostridia bacterium]|nr:hypothetical protein [Clostridia bacterium]